MAPPPRYDADLRAAKEEVDVEREAKEKLAKENEALAAEHAALQDKVKVSCTHSKTASRSFVHLVEIHVCTCII